MDIINTDWLKSNIFYWAKDTFEYTTDSIATEADIF